MREDMDGQTHAGGERPQEAEKSAGEPAVVVLCDDVMQSIRFEDAIRNIGGRPVVTDVDSALAAIDGNFPVLILVDLGASGDWAEVIRRAKLRPHSKQIPLYAFGSHVDTATLRRARTAGADHAWARSRMMDEFVEVVQRYVNPPVRCPDGWEDAPSSKALAGIEAFNHGDYFEQHELLEEAWMDEPRAIRDLYQGILQVGLAFYQIELGRWAGAMKMFGRGLPKLHGLPEVCHGVEVGEFRRQAETIRNDVARLGPERLDEFDHGRFPQIELVEQD